MDEQADIERKLALIERVDRPIAMACGTVLAVVYFLWRLLAQNFFATVTWMIAFFVGAAIPYFVTSVMTERLERRRRGLAGMGAMLPLARVVAVARDTPSRPAIPLRPSLPIESVEQTPMSEEPRLLK